MKNIIGIVGWSGSGKTDLVSRLINFFVLNSIVVSSVKHTHHEFEIDKKGKDSFKHIHAGSSEVIIFSKKNGQWLVNCMNKKLKLKRFLISLIPKQI